MHGSQTPSAWVQRWSSLLEPGATVLDLACGHGRHMRWFQSRGHAVLGVDRSVEALAASAPYGETLLADIENEPWPLTGRRFDAVVVTNYLWRPLVDAVRASLAEGGVLIWETFARGNETVGKPSNPDFLLQHGELLAFASGLRVVAFEDGFMPAPDRFVQRLAAVREAPSPTARRYPL